MSGLSVDVGSSLPVQRGYALRAILKCGGNAIERSIRSYQGGSPKESCQGDPDHSDLFDKPRIDDHLREAIIRDEKFSTHIILTQGSTDEYRYFFLGQESC